MKEQSFEDYKSKYLDLYDKVKTNNSREKVSILNDVDFELELIHRDEINVSYILRLLAKLKNTGDKEVKHRILDLLDSELNLRNKRELIKKFIEVNLPKIEDSNDIVDKFDSFWTVEREQAFKTICEEEKLNPEKFQLILEDYLFTERKPLGDDVLKIRIGEQPKILERRAIAERILNKLTDFVDTFINGMS